MWERMMGYGYGGWQTMGWSMAGASLVWLLVLAVVVLIILRAMRSSAHPPGGTRSSALSILGERYARCEIQQEEYLQKKKDLAPSEPV